MKRAIVLDMDETLEHGTVKDRSVQGDDELIMTLRPGIEKLVEKLKAAKGQGVDIILCTTAVTSWVERFLTLKPEFRELFDKVYTRDNDREWNQTFTHSKPVEKFGYDSVLFIDDNTNEKHRLQRVLDTEHITEEEIMTHIRDLDIDDDDEIWEYIEGEREVDEEAIRENAILQEIHQKKQLPSPLDITYFSGFGFTDKIDYMAVLQYMDLVKNNPFEIPNLQETLAVIRSNPGCDMMCSVIDDFLQKEFTPGFTSRDEDFAGMYEAYERKLVEWRRNIQSKIGSISSFISEHKDEITAYMNTDKTYPFEGLERLLLQKQVEMATETQGKLVEAKKLEQAYTDVIPQKTEEQEH